jgi:hypothetical protein
VLCFDSIDKIHLKLDGERSFAKITIYHTNEKTKKWIMKTRSRSHLYVVACQMRINPSSNPIRIIGSYGWKQIVEVGF